MPGMTHPRTGAYYGLDSVIYAIGVELAHMWGAPTLAGSFGSGAQSLGWEFSSGGGKASFLCALCGGETGSGMGLLRGSTLLVPEALVLDAELYHTVRAELAELDTSPEYMALDVIDAVGPRGHFLRERHTRDFFRKLDFSEIQYVPAKDGEYRDVLEVAREKTDWILENHHPEPLSDEQQKELSRIVKAAEEELMNKEK
jgi:trimethylamine--corrinoid protein Co-methyltransferase